MLLYHFGSKAELLDALLDHLRADELRLMQNVLDAAQPGDRPSQLLERAWAQVSRPESLRLVRLGLDIEAQRAFDDAAFAAWTERQRREWSELGAAVIERSAVDSSLAGLAPLLHIAVKGLLRELVAGGDPSDVNDAMAALGVLLDAASPEAAPPQDRSGAPDADAVDRARVDDDALSAADAWLGGAGPVQVWLGATALPTPSDRCRLQLTPRPELLDGDRLGDEVVRAFVELTARLGATQLAGTSVADLRIDAVAAVPPGPITATARVVRGDLGGVVEVAIDGRVPTVLARARLES
ncbi:MAG: hypothetical protein AAFP84_20455 [Actinomycetota bacterium]